MDSSILHIQSELLLVPSEMSVTDFIPLGGTSDADIAIIFFFFFLQTPAKDCNQLVKIVLVCMLHQLP